MTAIEIVNAVWPFAGPVALAVVAWVLVRQIRKIFREVVG